MEPQALIAPTTTKVYLLSNYCLHCGLKATEWAGYSLPSQKENSQTSKKLYETNADNAMRSLHLERSGYGFENLYPAGHPYHIPTIGTHEDIENAKMEDVKSFFNKWYVPSNASLVVCGDFDTQEAKELIESYFGEVPAGDPVQSSLKRSR